LTIRSSERRNHVAFDNQTDHSGLYSFDTQNMKVKRPIFTKRKPPTRRVEKLIISYSQGYRGDNAYALPLPSNLATMRVCTDHVVCMD
jgi:hypothetical protein